MYVYVRNSLFNLEWRPAPEAKFDDAAKALNLVFDSWNDQPVSPKF